MQTRLCQGARNPEQGATGQAARRGAVLAARQSENRQPRGDAQLPGDRAENAKELRAPVSNRAC